MSEKKHPYHVTVKATSPKGEVTYTTKGGETAGDARRKAIRWGVGYYLYDNGYITGDRKAFIAASEANKMRDAGDRLDYDGFTFEVMPVDLLTGA